MLFRKKCRFIMASLSGIRSIVKKAIITDPITCIRGTRSRYHHREVLIDVAEIEISEKRIIQTTQKKKKKKSLELRQQRLAVTFFHSLLFIFML